jgi:hypothetical protein
VAREIGVDHIVRIPKGWPRHSVPESTPACGAARTLS